MIVDNTAMPGDGAENSRLVSPMIQEVSSQCIMEFSYYLSGLGRYFNVPQVDSLDIALFISGSQRIRLYIRLFILLVLLFKVYLG